MAVIVVSRQTGSGGEEIAELLAERLQIPYLDREIIRKAASNAGVSERSIQDAERAPSFLERMAELLGRYPTFDVAGMPTGMPTPPPLSVDSYRKLIEDVIRNVASSGSAVIVGHAAQVILRENPNTLRVHVYAPFASRVKRVMAEESLRLNQAEKRVREVDREWEEYFRLYYGVKWLDPELYDLMINTRLLGVEGGLQIILEALKSI